MKLDSAQRGALVGEVLPNSPAEKAGLRGSSQQVTIDGQTVNVGGDVITAIDGQPVVEMNDIIAYLASNTQVGQKVTLTIIRDGKQENSGCDIGSPSFRRAAKLNKPLYRPSQMAYAWASSE